MADRYLLEDNGIIDSYPESNVSTYINLINAQQTYFGQTFTGNGQTISSVQFMLKRTGAPVSPMQVYIYALTGTPGTNAKPDGTFRLAISDAVLESDVTDEGGLVSFNFTGANKIVLANGVNYGVAVASFGSTVNYVSVGVDGTTPTDNGNGFLFDDTSGVWSETSTDTIFYVRPENTTDRYLLEDNVAIDSYPESNRNAYLGVDDTSSLRAQTFIGTGAAVSSVQFFLAKDQNSPFGFTSDTSARIYAATGTQGTNAVPSGTPLAISDPVNASTITDEGGLVSFNFSGVNKISLNSGQLYAVAFSGGGDYILYGIDNTTPTHSGNSSAFGSGSWTPDTTNDIIFYVNRENTTDYYLFEGPPTVTPNTADAASLSIPPVIEFTGSNSDDDPLDYQVEIDPLNTFVSSSSKITSFSAEYRTTGYSTTNTTRTRFGQTFKSNGASIISASFNLSKTGAPAGNVTVSLYDTTGNFTNDLSSAAIATGTPLVSAPSITANSLTTTYADYTFTFASPYATVADRVYAIVIEHANGAAGNTVNIATHGGNNRLSYPGNVTTFSTSTGLWTAEAGPLIHSVTAQAASIVATSTVESGFLNTVTPSDMNPFNSGQKISYTALGTESLSTSIYYFDGLLGITDPGNAWTNDSNAFDNTNTTQASTTTIGSALVGKGTTAPSSGAGIIKTVRVKRHSTNTNITYFFTLSKPSGGWTWAKLNALEASSVFTGDDIDNGFSFGSTTITTAAGGETLLTINVDSAGAFVGLIELEVTVNNPVALSPGTYHWRARAIDPSGSNTYSPFTTTRSFTAVAGGGGATFTKTQTTDSFIRRQRTATHTTSAFINRRRTAIHTTSSALNRRSTAAHTTSTFIRRNRTATHITSAFLLARKTLVHTTSSFIRRAITATHTTDAITRRVLMTSHTASAVLRRQLTTSHFTSSVIASRRTALHTTSSFLTARRTASHQTSAVTRTPATQISSIEQLAAIVGTGAITGNYALTRNLDFNLDSSYDNPANKSTYTTGSGWIPIGRPTVSWFAGTFDGQGYTISNLYIQNRASGGIFGIVDNCTIKNLGVINPIINTLSTANYNQQGALIGGIDPVGTVSVQNCYATGGEICGDDHVGGLIGIAHMYSTANVIIEDCYAQVKVSERGTFNDGFGFGGLIGTMNSISSGGSIIVRNSWSSGLVAPGATTNCGGFIGFNSAGATVTSCYWDTQTSNFATSAGGTGKTTAQMKTQSTFVNWSIAPKATHSTETWYIDGGNDYPRLYYQPKQVTLNRTHTTSSVIARRRTAVHTTDSFIRRNRTATHTTSAFLTARLTATHTTSAFIRRARTVVHTTSAVIRRAITISHSTSAVLRRQRTVIHTTSAVIRAVRSVSHTTSSVLRQTRTATHTTDSFLRRQRTATHTTSSVIRIARSVVHTTSSVMRRQRTATHTTSSVLRRTLTRTHTTSTVIRKTNVVTHTTSAVIRRQRLDTHTTDSVTKSRLTASHTTDTNLVNRFAVEHFTDSWIEYIPGPNFGTLVDSFNNGPLDTSIWAATPANATGPAVVEDGKVRIDLAAFGASSVLETAQVYNLKDSPVSFELKEIFFSPTDLAARVEFSLIGHTGIEIIRVRFTPQDVISGQEIEVSFYDGAEFGYGQFQSTIMRYFQFIVEPSNNTLYLYCSADNANWYSITGATYRGYAERAYLRFSGSGNEAGQYFYVDNVNSNPDPTFVLSHDTDSVIRTAGGAIHTTDSFIRLQNNLTHTTDTNLRRQIATSHTTSSVLRRNLTVVHTTSSVIRRSRLATHTTSAFIRRARTLTHNTSSFIRRAVVRTHTTDAFLYRNNNVTHQTSSVIRRVRNLSHTTSAIIRRSRSATHTTSAVLASRRTSSHTTSAFLNRRIAITHTTSSVIRKVNAVSHSTSTIIRKTNVVSHTTSSVIAGRRTATHTTSTFLKRRTAISHQSSAFLRRQRTASHTTDSVITTARGLQHTTNSVIRKVNTRTHTTDTFLLKRVTVSHTTSTFLKRRTITAHTTSSVVRKQNTSQHTTDVFIKGRRTASHTTGTFLKRRVTLSHSTSTYLVRRAIRTHTTNAYLRNRPHFPVKPRAGVKPPRVMAGVTPRKPQGATTKAPRPGIGQTAAILSRANIAKVINPMTEDTMSTNVLMDDAVELVDGNSDTGSKFYSAENIAITPVVRKPRLQGPR